MGTVLLVIGALAVALYFFLRSDRGKRAALGSAPMGAFLRASDKGASPEDAIYDAIQFLRYRAPWNTITESGLRNAARTLAQLDHPKDFIEAVIAVEEVRSLDPILDIQRLESFVRLVNDRRRQSPS